MKRIGLFLILMLLGTGQCFAQQTSKELEAKRAKAVKKAQAAVAKAFKTIEAFGSKEKQQRTAQMLRRLAEQRLTGEESASNQKREKTPSLEEQYQEMLSYRAQVLERLRQLDPDRYSVEDEEVEVEESIYKRYDVTDLTITAPDHPTGNVGLGSNIDVGGATLHFGEEDEEYSNTRLSPEVVLEIFESQLSEADLEEHSLDISQGQLVVNGVPRVHKTIADCLKQLRENRGRLIRIEVQALSMPASKFSAYCNSPVLSNKAVEELEKQIKAGTIKRSYLESAIAYDGQKISIRKGATSSSVADIEVNQTGVVPVLNPVVVSIREGLLAEVRPQYLRANKSVELNMSLSLSVLDKEREKRLVQPGRINNDHAASKSLPPYQLELSKMQISRQTAAAIVPLGKLTFISGFSSGTENEQNITTVICVRATIVDKKD